VVILLFVALWTFLNNEGRRRREEPEETLGMEGSAPFPTNWDVKSQTVVDAITEHFKAKTISQLSSTIKTTNGVRMPQVACPTIDSVTLPMLFLPRGFFVRIEW
jgi:hypothetical protein